MKLMKKFETLKRWGKVRIENNEYMQFSVLCRGLSYTVYSPSSSAYLWFELD